MTVSGIIAAQNQEGGHKMPPIFKALATISVWILFIFGCILLINTIVIGIIEGLSPLETMAGGGIAMVSLTLSVCAMKLRQMLE